MTTQLRDYALRELPRLKKKLLRAAYFDEAHCVELLAETPTVCDTAYAQFHLQNANEIAKKYGFSATSEWIEAALLPEAELHYA